MNNTSLLILAGGMGSRYKGQKQIDKITEKETLMEFALYDALHLGIRNFVMIINDQFPLEFQLYLKNILQLKQAEITFITQTNEVGLPEEFQSKYSERTKPLGTGHAVLLAKNSIKGPFLTMNADDFYGNESFRLGLEMAKNLQQNEFGLIAFELGKTLSENGKVSRGICQIKNGNLISVEEHTEIESIENQIFGMNSHQEKVELHHNDFASMNLWVLQPEFFQIAEKEFHNFLLNSKDLLKDEFYLPFIIDQSIHQQNTKVLVKQTPSKWMGLTYAEDKNWVKNEIQNAIDQNEYPKNLWE